MERKIAAAPNAETISFNYITGETTFHQEGFLGYEETRARFALLAEVYKTLERCIARHYQEVQNIERKLARTNRRRETRLARKEILKRVIPRFERQAEELHKMIT